VSDISKGDPMSWAGSGSVDLFLSRMCFGHVKFRLLKLIGNHVLPLGYSL